MAIEVVPYAPEQIPAVHAFNGRLRDGGSDWGFYEKCEPDWIPPRPDQRVWREYYVALDEGEDVRGAYVLKPQSFLIRGEEHLVSGIQGPVSEGIVDRRYNSIALRLLQDMQRRRPLLYTWGMGGPDKPLPRMLRALGWLMADMPFCLRVVHPFRFLRHNRFLRSSPRHRLALDALAWSGLGSLGLRATQAALSLRGQRPSGISVEVVDTFGDWADALWERASSCYSALAVRDAASLNVLLPSEGWPQSIRLKLTRDGEILGWAVVLDTAMQDDSRFGDLRVGSLIDFFARPEDAEAVVRGATRHLAARGVDLVAANLSHPVWVRGFAAAGFIVLPERRTFAASKALRKLLEPTDETMAGLHLTLLDGDGPRGF